MIGTGFNGLVVHHGGLTEVTDHLHRMVQDIDDRMANLERDLSPLRSEWSGNAQAAYLDAKRTWDAAIAEMRQVLGDTATVVGRSNSEYHAADLRGAGQFRIG